MCGRNRWLVQGGDGGSPGCIRRQGGAGGKGGRAESGRAVIALICTTVAELACIVCTCVWCVWCIVCGVWWPPHCCVWCIVCGVGRPAGVWWPPPYIQTASHPQPVPVRPSKDAGKFFADMKICMKKIGRTFLHCQARVQKSKVCTRPTSWNLT